MRNIFKPTELGLRLTEEYLKARSLLEEKREAMARVVEINRALRSLSEEKPEAVQTARGDIPFRRGHGTQKPAEKAVPVSVL